MFYEYFVFFKVCSRKCPRCFADWKEDTVLESKAIPAKINTGRQKAISNLGFALLDSSFTSGNCLSWKLNRIKELQATWWWGIPSKMVKGRSRKQKLGVVCVFIMSKGSVGKNVGFREQCFFLLSLICGGEHAGSNRPSSWILPIVFLSCAIQWDSRDWKCASPFPHYLSLLELSRGQWDLLSPPYVSWGRQVLRKAGE